MRSTVEATGVTATRAGSRSMASASSAMSFGMVAEKNSVCRLIGSLRDDFADVVDEAHVEHAVGFVEHQEFDLVELQPVALDEIEQAAGGRHQDFDALHDRADLAAHRHAADRQRRGQADVAAIGVEAVEDLAGQFAGRREHQHAAGLGLRPDPVFQNAVQDRQREGRGLAGAGLGDADDVAAGDGERDGLGLDRRGRVVIFFLECTRNGFGKAEILKGGQKRVLSIKRQAPDRYRPGAREGVSETPACLGRRFC